MRRAPFDPVCASPLVTLCHMRAYTRRDEQRASALDSLDTLIADARARLLRMHFETRSGHVGGNLSCLDALLVLHHRVLQAQDRFILSKGHAAGALYITLWSLGLLTDDDLLTF